MELLFEYLCAIWMLAGCMLGMLVIGAFIKAIFDMLRRKK